jgi:hypothetical protein
MECDWEVEIGAGAPVIDAAWPGFVDLRQEPMRVHQLSEVGQFPALASVLIKLNTSQSPVSTSKCDFWPALPSEDFNADELDAVAGCSNVAAACYMDLLPGPDRSWTSTRIVETLCKPWCGRLRAAPLRCCRADFVVRAAITEYPALGLGITAYITACGATASEAKAVLGSALATLADALCSDSTLQ